MKTLKCLLPILLLSVLVACGGSSGDTCSEGVDDCGICGGDNSTCSDCNGVANGTAVEDDCGVCDGDNSTCTDCAGVINGTSTRDDCDVCDDDPTNDNLSCADCAGNPNGLSTEDACGVCDDNPDNDNETCTDCNGVVNGASTEDECGVCDEDPENDNATCVDCADVPNGLSTLDECGVCDDNPDNDNETCLDCAGVPNGEAVHACEFAGTSTCDGNTLVSCLDADEDGCRDLVTEECASSTPFCIEGDATSACIASADSCDDALTVTLPFTFAGESFSEYFTDSLNLEGDSCISGADLAEAVFRVSLVAGQTITVSEHGSIDIVMNVMTDTCDGATACVSSLDGFGSTEAVGTTYTAEETETAYVVFSPYSSFNADKDFDLRIVSNELCDNGIDDDLDGLADCDDSDCFGGSSCQAELNCTDGADNDLDETVDCLDEDCADICGDVICGDGFLDAGEECDDSNTDAGDGCSDLCTREGSCAAPLVVSGVEYQISGDDFGADFANDHAFAGTNCWSGGDDSPDAIFQLELEAGDVVLLDEPGSLDIYWQILGTECSDSIAECIDSADAPEEGLEVEIFESGTYFIAVESYCADPSDCSFGGTDYDIQIRIAKPEVCDDAFDNDFDGSADCDDSDCYGVGPCTTETSCEDGADNDADDATDCADEDCAEICAAFVCGDGVVQAATNEACDDGNTDDGDGCSSACVVEEGWDCAGEPTVCEPGVAGSCAVPVHVDSDAFVLSGEDFFTDFDDTQNFTCGYTQAGASDVVLKVDLLAGETVVLSEHGNIDVVLYVLGATCADDGECIQDSDFGEEAGLSYTAEDDGALYLAVSSYYETSSSSAYEIHVDVIAAEDCEDGTDNDGDGAADCDDSDCFGVGNCTTELNCEDGADNDADGNIDCADDDCAADALCAGAISLSTSPDAPINGDTPVVVSTIDFTDAGCESIDTIKVTVDISHVWIGDLQVGITNPTGTSVALHAGTGGSADDIIGTYPVDLTPAEDLAAFFGSPPQGVWTLTVEDTYPSSDHGNLNSWGLTITCGGAAPEVETDCGDGLDNDFDDALDCDDSDCTDDPICAAPITVGAAPNEPIDAASPIVASSVDFTDTDCEAALSVKVSVDISHEYIGDLVVDIAHPDGTTVTLHGGTGGSADDIIGTYPDDLTPAGDLTVFHGLPPQGTWTLTVEDTFPSFDDGNLNAWDLHIVCGSEGAGPVAETDCSDGVDNDGDDAIDCADDDCAADINCGSVSLGSCAAPVQVDSDTFVLSGEDFTADYGDSQSFACGDSQDGASDVVMEVNLLAGETVVLSEYGGADVVLYILGATCANDGECIDDTDFGEEEGLSYTATEDGSVYLAVSMWSSDPFTVDYEIHVDIIEAEACDDGDDNDLDGAVDCADSDCYGVGPCTTETECGDGEDNDADGVSDCEDDDCSDNILCGSAVIVSTDPNQPIDEDNAEFDSTIEFTDTCPSVVSLRVHVDITHSWIGDLGLTVIAPDGTTAVLHDYSGGSADDIVGVYPTTLTPVDDLSVFNGTAPQGTWTLTVSDSYPGSDDGVLNSWSVDVVCGDAPPVVAGIFISEYVEGTSNNKALEIYNPTDAGEDCTLTIDRNGPTSSPPSIIGSFSIESGATYVFCHSSGVASSGGVIPDEVCDMVTGSLSHNGNDSYILTCGGPIVVDVFGNPTIDPGSGGWDVNGVGTKDQTLRRKCEVVSGDPVGDDVFDPSVEWISYDANTVDGLGTHCE
ncbi:MAG: hypothetical protein CMH54_10215 [Myxococcales bacterium]|nr:hypothetical protein [Myxococcales bacterium]